jgi:hypothetical protein
LTASPDLGFSWIIGNDVLEVIFERNFVGCGFGVRDTLVEFDDDTCETVSGDEDFLVVGDFANITEEFVRINGSMKY